ncbi:BZIP-type transcription factor [Hirsutella rhossiliensis]|uniref:BZIP-type transcription factor n=1 Tax=Hirsutella rhossiliensis TaxID=111463 RepID=A0A9P8SJN8_9HYPO|nr:BZIP-type transcription factor [Hirsutella rhossiliensis]KAH0963231.1 BZIP-type transcription factor [Hirsutella rhossiliensis]
MRRLARTKSSRALAPTAGSDDGSDPLPPPPPPPPKTAEERNMHRRMQVRRAQIHHRQRKANHLKQLELDVCQLRDLIALAEHDTHALKRQNNDMRAILRTATAGEAAHCGGPPLPPHPAGPLSRQRAPSELFGDVDVDDLTVTLSVNDVMGTPCFKISPRSASASAGSSPSDSGCEVPLTPEQEQRAINFILALEHVCWDHFALGDFHSHTHESEEPRGHALIASAYLMASAPESVYTQREAFNSPGRSIWRRSSRRSASPPVLSWPAPAMTLASLLGLARSLNPGEDETTPVQAWFELAARYPASLLLGGGALDALLREFKGVVRCVQYGAAIERLAFESVVARVLGPSGPPVPVPVSVYG